MEVRKFYNDRADAIRGRLTVPWLLAGFATGLCALGIAAPASARKSRSSELSEPSLEGLMNVEQQDNVAILRASRRRGEMRNADS